MYTLGVRSSLLLNKFDNPLTGVRFDGGPIGVLINGGQQAERRLVLERARPARARCTTTRSRRSRRRAARSWTARSGRSASQSGTVPAYPPAPHCNTRGLTTLGRHVVRRMMDLHMIVNPDHMSQAAVDDTLTLLESRQLLGRHLAARLDGPRQLAAAVEARRRGVPRPLRRRPTTSRTGRSTGRGARPTSSAGATAPTSAGCRTSPTRPRTASITYPFKSYDGRSPSSASRPASGPSTTPRRASPTTGCTPTGSTTSRRLGGNTLARDMWDGAEAYLEMWERAAGDPRPATAPSPTAPVSSRGLGADPPRRRLGERCCAAPASRSSARARGAGA